MKLVIKNNKVLATHDDNQAIEKSYPDCQFVIDDNFSGQVGDDYIITERQHIQAAKATRDTAYDNITNSVILDQLAIINLDLELANATITQAEYDAQKLIYNNRIKAKATLFATATSNFYTTTGLTAPTITV